MKPKLPTELLDELRSSGQAPPWRCKLHLRRGSTLYGVEINAKGEITRIGERTIWSVSDIGFRLTAVERASLQRS